MKISKLYIEEYKQLKNLDFDFTYPDDFHDETKRGKPLEKICFIGQSGTGKTNLLDIFYNKCEKLTSILVINSQSKTFSYVDLKSNYRDLACDVSFIVKKSKIDILYDKIKIDNKEYSEYNGFSYNKSSNSSNDKPKLIYLKANLISENNLNIFNQHPTDLNEKYNEELDSSKHLKEETINIYDENVNEEKWLSLLEEYISFNKKFTQKMSELIHKGLIADAKKLEQEYKIWEKQNPKKLNNFAEFFNPILNKLNLAVDLVNTEYSIPINNKITDTVIPIKETSTGTKGLLLSFVPLFNTNTKDSIILIDEPERSLFPDIQMELMDYYQNAAPDAQFVIATHSPFIAASFEPEERFILYFDQEGKVAVRRGSSPIGDDPNDMLHNDFNIDFINKYGQEKYKEYVDLKQKAHFEKNEDLKKEYIEKLEKLGEKYNF